MSRFLSILMRSFFLLACTALSADYIWSPPVQLSDPATSSIMPSVATDPNGNAVAVWVEDNFSNFVVRAATKLFGQAWSTPQTISDPNDIASSPIVQVDNNGNAVVVWFATTFFNTSLKSSTKLFGQAWSTPIALPSVSSVHMGLNTNAFVMDVASGTSTVLWLEPSITPALYSSSLPLGGNAWSSRLLVFNLTTVVSVSAAIDGSGNVIATWQGGSDTYTALQVPNQAWQQLSPSPVVTLGQSPRVAMNQTGDAITICATSSGAQTVSKTSSQSSWDAAETIPGSPMYAQAAVNVALDSSGNAVAIWWDGFGGIGTSTKLAGQAWSQATVLSTSGSVTATPSVAISSDGTVLMIWDDTNGSIMEASGSVGGPYSQPTALGSGISPAFSQFLGRYALVVWQGNQGSPSDIEASQGIFLSAVTSFSGVQRKNDFGTVSEYENRLKWTFTPSSTIAGFQLCRNGAPLARLSSKENDYVDPDQKRNVPIQYSLSVIDNQGNLSTPLVITVP